jgi:hypothetical protein
MMNGSSLCKSFFTLKLKTGNRIKLSKHHSGQSAKPGNSSQQLFFGCMSAFHDNCPGLIGY